MANTECASEVRSCHSWHGSQRVIYQVVRRRQETYTELQHVHLTISDMFASNRSLDQHLTIINTVEVSMCFLAQEVFYEPQIIDRRQ